MSRLDRFRKLESPRTERTGEGQKKTQERFNRMEPERAPSQVPPPPPRGPANERIERQMSDPPLALDSRNKQEQQFIRCMHCEADNSRFAQVCIHCGAALQTDEQRDYNEKFWQQRQEQVAEEKQAVEQFHANGERMIQAQAAAREQAYAAMAEEARGDGLSTGYGGVPPGVRLIRAIESPGWQWAAAGGFVLVGVLSFAGLANMRHGGQDWLTVACMGALLGLVILFTPPSWWAYRGRRRRSWFFDNDDYFP